MFFELKQIVDEQNEEAMRYLAKHDLGIDTDGKTKDEVVKELNEKGISGAITNAIEYGDSVTWFVFYVEESSEKLVSGGRIEVTLVEDELQTKFSQITKEGLEKVARFVEEGEENENV